MIGHSQNKRKNVKLKLQSVLLFSFFPLIPSSTESTNVSSHTITTTHEFSQEIQTL